MNRSLPKPLIAAADAAKILGIRADADREHRFTGVWPVVVKGRLFARSWDGRSGGWFKTLLEDPRATVQVGERQVRVRGVVVKSEMWRDAVDAAYAAKYTTPASQKWVRGFRSKRRREATVEFVPR